jgi:hypothetical protein
MSIVLAVPNTVVHLPTVLFFDGLYYNKNYALQT